MRGGVLGALKANDFKIWSYNTFEEKVDQYNNEDLTVPVRKLVCEVG